MRHDGQAREEEHRNGTEACVGSSGNHGREETRCSSPCQPNPGGPHPTEFSPGTLDSNTTKGNVCADIGSLEEGAFRRLCLDN